MLLARCWLHLCILRVQAGMGRHQGMLDALPRLMVVFPVTGKGLPAACWLLAAWFLFTGTTHMHGSDETARAAVCAAPVLALVCSQRCSMCCLLSSCMQKHFMECQSALNAPFLLMLTIPESR